MPYDINNPPEKLRGLSEDKQQQWIHVYESCIKDHNDDIKCQKMAWGVTGGWKDKGEDSDATTPKSIDSNDITGVGDLELPVYDSTNSKSIEELISKEIGIEVEIKTPNDIEFVFLED